jgi:hypothetical protein
MANNGKQTKSYENGSSDQNPPPSGSANANMQIEIIISSEKDTLPNADA